MLDDRHVTYDELRRAAVALSARLAAGSVQPGDVVLLLGRHSIEAAVALLGCLHRGVVLAPLPPMFNVAQLVGARAPDAARGRSSAFGGEKEIAKCARGRAEVAPLIAIARRDAGRADRRGRAGRAPRAPAPTTSPW